ncbi:MAG: BlaI/MecI/CopY family transcriptional regulator [Bacteroidales bacterium]|jgi:BlaI family transcriptional regulator, penicillinase repressor
MKQLTKAEEQIMQILWKLEKAFVKDIMVYLPEPKPAYNTVSTIVRIMEKKGFVGYKAYGKTHEYFPLISKPEYTKRFLRGFVKDYFSNSYKQMVSFFAKDEKLSLTEMEEMRKLIEEEINKQKEKGK